MTTLSFVNTILALGTIIGQLFILASVVYFLFFKKKQNVVTVFLAKYGITFAFIVALISMLGSLFYSEIARFAPCDLCWLQRIFMYPLVFILGLALIKKDNRIVDYVLSLSIIGGIISLYHNFMGFGGFNGFCPTIGSLGVSCAKRYVLAFGYVTIPMMALTAFLLIIVLLLFKKMENKYV